MISSSEVLRRVDCSYRQLDYWCRSRVIVPAVEAKGTGMHRRFTERQVRQIQMTCDLASMGAQAPVLRRANQLVELIPEDAWKGTCYITPVGELSAVPPRGPAWTIDLASCVERSRDEEPEQLKLPA